MNGPVTADGNHQIEIPGGTPGLDRGVLRARRQMDIDFVTHILQAPGHGAGIGPFAGVARIRVGDHKQSAHVILRVERPENKKSGGNVWESNPPRTVNAPDRRI